MSKRVILFIILLVSVFVLAVSAQSEEELLEEELFKEYKSKYLEPRPPSQIPEKERVTEQQLQEYILTYLTHYRILIEHNFNESERESPSFYSRYPYWVAGTIYNNGVVIQFFPDSIYNHSLQGTSQNVEYSDMGISGYRRTNEAFPALVTGCNAIGVLNGPSNVIIKDNHFSDSKLVICDNIKNISLENIEKNEIIICLDIQMFTMRNVSFYPLTLYYSSLNASDYTKDRVIDNLNHNFQEAIIISYLREIIATAENLNNETIRIIAANFLEKVMSGGYINTDNPFEFDETLATLDTFARNHGIEKPEIFTNKISREQQYQEQEALKTPLEKHPNEAFLLGILLGTLIGYITGNITKINEIIKAIRGGYASKKQKKEVAVIIILIIISCYYVYQILH